MRAGTRGKGLLMKWITCAFGSGRPSVAGGWRTCLDEAERTAGMAEALRGSRYRSCRREQLDGRRLGSG